MGHDCLRTEIFGAPNSGPGCGEEMEDVCQAYPGSGTRQIWRVPGYVLAVFHLFSGECRDMLAVFHLFPVPELGAPKNRP